jgi:hypothetical protein
LQFLEEKKNIKFFPAVIFFFQFLIVKTLDSDWYRIQAKMPDPELESMSPVAKHKKLVILTIRKGCRVD